MLAAHVGQAAGVGLRPQEMSDSSKGRPWKTSTDSPLVSPWSSNGWPKWTVRKVVVEVPLGLWQAIPLHTNIPAIINLLPSLTTTKHRVL